MFYLIFTFSMSVFIFHFSLPSFTCSFPSLNIFTICDQSHCPWRSLQFSLQGAAFFLVLSSSGLSLLDFTFIASPQSLHRLCWAGPPSALTWNCFRPLGQRSHRLTFFSFPLGSQSYDDSRPVPENHGPICFFH